VLKKKMWANFQRIIELFTKKIVKKLLKIPMVLGSGIGDPRSGIRKKPIPDPGSRGQKAPDPDPQHWIPYRTTCIILIPSAVDPDPHSFECSGSES
jgi:hypothetical protein